MTTFFRSVTWALSHFIRFPRDVIVKHSCKHCLKYKLILLQYWRAEHWLTDMQNNAAPSVKRSSSVSVPPCWKRVTTEIRIFSQPTDKRDYLRTWSQSKRAHNAALFSSQIKTPSCWGEQSAHRPWLLPYSQLWPESRPDAWTTARASLCCPRVSGTSLPADGHQQPCVAPVDNRINAPPRERRAATAPKTMHARAKSVSKESVFKPSCWPVNQKKWVKQKLHRWTMRKLFIYTSCPRLLAQQAVQTQGLVFWREGAWGVRSESPCSDWLWWATKQQDRSSWERPSCHPSPARVALTRQFTLEERYTDSHAHTPPPLTGPSHSLLIASHTFSGFTPKCPPHPGPCQTPPGFSKTQCMQGRREFPTHRLIPLFLAEGEKETVWGTRCVKAVWRVWPSVKPEHKIRVVYHSRNWHCTNGRSVLPVTPALALHNYFSTSVSQQLTAQLSCL